MSLGSILMCHEIWTFARSRASRSFDRNPLLRGTDGECGKDDRPGRGCTEARPTLPELPPPAVNGSAPRRKACGSVVCPRARRRADRAATLRPGAECPLGVGGSPGKRVTSLTLV